MAGIETSGLVAALVRLVERPRLNVSEVARKARLSQPTLFRIINSGAKPRPETWEKLYMAFPEHIPRPPWINGGATGPIITATVEPGPMTKIPIFDAGLGEPSTWSDGGYPVGEASNYMPFLRDWIDENTFALRCHGESMKPIINEGDIVIVVPSLEVHNGDLCFATWADHEFGERLVKRFRRIDDKTIILESVNPEHNPIILTEENGKNVRIFKVGFVVQDFTRK